MNDLVEVPSGFKVADFPTGYASRDEIIRTLVIQRDSWRLTAKTCARGHEWLAGEQSTKDKEK